MNRTVHSWPWPVMIRHHFCAPIHPATPRPANRPAQRREGSDAQKCTTHEAWIRMFEGGMLLAETCNPARRRRGHTFEIHKAVAHVIRQPIASPHVGLIRKQQLSCNGSHLHRILCHIPFIPIAFVGAVCGCGCYATSRGCTSSGPGELVGNGGGRAVKSVGSCFRVYAPKGSEQPRSPPR